MEADSTTYDNNLDGKWPFPVCPINFKLFKDLTEDQKEQGPIESQIVKRLQDIGLLKKNMECPTGKPGCQVICKSAKVVDRVQWICKECGTRQAVRLGTFFKKVPCSLLQCLQIMLAWCEDADNEVAATHFDVKLKVANMIYDKLDELAISEQKKCKLGGENSVVLVEMYPDCMTRMSPDTTDPQRSHKILMLADTNHVPTRYSLHIMKEYPKKTTNDQTQYYKVLKRDIEKIIQTSTHPNSTIVTSTNVPQLDGATPAQTLLQSCDADMQHFLSSGMWRGAVTLCAAAASLDARAAAHYLLMALYRRTHTEQFFEHMLNLLAAELTSN